MAVRRRKGVTYEPSGDKVVILDANGEVLTTLNAVGAVIWRALDGDRDSAALALDLAPAFDDITPARLQADIDEFLSELAAADLVEPA